MKAGLPAVVRGLAVGVPPDVVRNDHFAARFGEQYAKDLERVVGIRERRWSNGRDVVDLALPAARRLLEQLHVDPQDVDAVVFVTQTPPQKAPGAACALAARLGLPDRAAAYDVNQGCAGWIYGLWIAGAIAQTLHSTGFVLLACGDVTSAHLDESDRATAPLFGDAVAVALVDSPPEALGMDFVFGTDGTGIDLLGIRQPDPVPTVAGGMAATIESCGESLYMQGQAVVEFALKRVPQAWTKLVDQSMEPELVLFHQANASIVRMLGRRCGLPAEKTPTNIARWGNTSSASIPLLMADDQVGAVLRARQANLVMLGFGIGLSWGAAYAKVGPLKCCEILEVP